MWAQVLRTVSGESAARLSRVATLSCALSFAGANAALADVLEISANGDVAVLAGPALTTPEAVTPIAPATREQGSPAMRARLQVAAHASDLSPELVNAIAWAESRFNDRALSPAGAIGVMQLMPATAATLGVDPTDPTQNARGGAAYVRQMLDTFDGDLTLALAAYNAGPEAVRRHNGVPPFAETQAYVASVLDYMARHIETGEP